MAALRFFARSALSGSRRAAILNADAWKIPLTFDQQIKRRCHHPARMFRKPEEPRESPDFEVSKDPKEWSYVEWCLREKVIPEAPTECSDLPSGWKPQTAASRELPYLVERTKNHMVPVYLKISERGQRKVTIVRRVQGDIEGLAKELQKHVEEKAGRPVGMQINEPAGLIKFRGDHVTNCRQFLDGKGF